MKAQEDSTRPLFLVIVGTLFAILANTSVNRNTTCNIMFWCCEFDRRMTSTRQRRGSVAIQRFLWLHQSWASRLTCVRISLSFHSHIGTSSDFFGRFGRLL